MDSDEFIEKLANLQRVVERLEKALDGLNSQMDAVGEDILEINKRLDRLVSCETQLVNDDCTEGGGCNG